MNPDQEKQIVIPLLNGGSLICDAGEDYLYGGSLTVTYPDGREPLVWVSQEWADDPEQVIGAVFAAAAEGPVTHVMVPIELLGKLREHFSGPYGLREELDFYLPRPDR